MRNKVKMPTLNPTLDGMKILKQAEGRVTQKRGGGETAAKFRGSWKSKPTSKR